MEALGLAALLARHLPPALAAHAAALAACRPAAAAKAAAAAALHAVGADAFLGTVDNVHAPDDQVEAARATAAEASGAGEGVCGLHRPWMAHAIYSAAPWWERLLLHEDKVAMLAAVAFWLLPAWCALLGVKLALGYGVRWLARRYNRYYDSNFKRLFKTKH